MDSAIYECPMCMSYYDRDEHRPMGLRCGHTSNFCGVCLRREDVVTFCRQCHGFRLYEDILSLPVCHQLMPKEVLETDESKMKKCPDHCSEIILWCLTCSKYVCKECVVRTHKTCDFDLTEKAGNCIRWKVSLKTKKQFKHLKTLIVSDRQDIYLLWLFMKRVNEIIIELEAREKKLLKVLMEIKMNWKKFNDTAAVDGSRNGKAAVQWENEKQDALKKIKEVEIPKGVPKSRFMSHIKAYKNSSTVHKCPKCKSVYNRDDHQPLLLPCGHSFCESCVSAKDSRKCFSCKSSFAPKKLPTCYQLMPLKEDKLDICYLHDFSLLFVCERCMVLVCRQCIVVNHNKCQLILRETHSKATYSEKSYSKTLDNKLFQISNLKSRNKDQITLLITFTAAAVKLFRKLCEQDIILFDLQTVFIEIEKVLAKSKSDRTREAAINKIKEVDVPTDGLQDRLLDYLCKYQDQPVQTGTSPLGDFFPPCPPRVPNGPDFHSRRRSSLLQPDLMLQDLLQTDASRVVGGRREPQNKEESNKGRCLIRAPSKMDSTIYECPMCMTYYDRDEHRPMGQPCGHTSCRACLRQMFGMFGYCHQCYALWFSVDSLPVCHQLMPKETLEIHASKMKKCPDHCSEIILWCLTCSKYVCKECVVRTHKTCDFDLSEKAGNCIQRKMRLKSKKQFKHLKTLILSDRQDINQLSEFMKEAKEIRNELEAHKKMLCEVYVEIEMNKKKFNDTAAVDGSRNGKTAVQWENEKQDALKKIEEVEIPKGVPKSRFMSHIKAYKKFSTVRKCPKCKLVYNRDNLKPLLLPCGHSICESCVSAKNFKKSVYDRDDIPPFLLPSGHSFCESCVKDPKKGFSSKSSFTPSKLTTCYQLIPLKKDKSEICYLHKFPLLFVCRTCKVLVCRQCIVVKHNKCQLILRETHSKATFCVEMYPEEYQETLDNKFVQIGNLKSRNKEQITLLTTFTAAAVELFRKLCEHDTILFDLQTVIIENEKVLAKSKSDLTREAAINKIKEVDVPTDGLQDRLLDYLCKYQEQPVQTGTSPLGDFFPPCPPRVPNGPDFHSRRRSSLLQPDLILQDLLQTDASRVVGGRREPQNKEKSNKGRCLIQ